MGQKSEVETTAEKQQDWELRERPITFTGRTARDPVLKGQSWDRQQPAIVFCQSTVLCPACFIHFPPSPAKKYTHKQWIYFGGPVSFSVPSRCSTNYIHTTKQLRWNSQFQNWPLTCSELEKTVKKLSYEMQKSEETHLFLKTKK